MAEGTAAAAGALGFVDATHGGLTSLGERYALAEAGERRPLLREALLRYAPYREMLRALAERGAAGETEVRWVEAWWATRGYGSSESNRREGAAAFGRLADHAGLGEYVPGRRGRPTRIRWAPGALPTNPDAAAPRARARRPSDPTPDLFSAGPEADPPARSGRDAPLDAARPSIPPPSEPARPAPRSRTERPVNRITVPLADDATARIEVPVRLPRAEKRRLLDLLELLITEE
jgi:hypothetical protein